MARLADIVAHADELLDVERFPEYGRPGLQVVGADEVTKLVCGVSSTRELFERARDDGAQLVLVHHGLFWRNEPLLIDRRLKGRLEALFAANASLLAYHLALANYMNGDYQKAAAEYDTCVATAKTPENTFACSAWQYAALIRAGRKEEAAKVLERAAPDVELKGSEAYLDRLLLFKGAKSEEEVAKRMATDNLQLPTVAYGPGLWHLVNGRDARAREYFEKAVAPPAQQTAFGSVAAYYLAQMAFK